MINKSLQTEIDASFLYDELAKKEKDPTIAYVFQQMSDIEKGHAIAFAKNKNIDIDSIFHPSWRAKTIILIGKIFGYDYILGVMMDTEKMLSNKIIDTKNEKKLAITGTETNHVNILQSILQQDTKNAGKHIAKFEKKHRSVWGNAIRAAVLWGNDGLVSNFSLVMGIAGATAGWNEALLAGMAWLLAGALSMSLGEWISVKSSQELYENQIQIEMDELENNPEWEEKELALIYMTKWIPKEQAHQMAADIMKDKNLAHNTLIKEELGINPEEIEWSAMEAAVYSFILFGIGAIIPVFPFIFTTGTKAIILSIIASSIWLFLIGGAITLFTGKNVWYSWFRQVFFGLAAAAITFWIGKVIGVAIG